MQQMTVRLVKPLIFQLYQNDKLIAQLHGAYENDNVASMTAINVGSSVLSATGSATIILYTIDREWEKWEENDYDSISDMFDKNNGVLVVDTKLFGFMLV